MLVKSKNIKPIEYPIFVRMNTQLYWMMIYISQRPILKTLFKTNYNIMAAICGIPHI